MRPPDEEANLLSMCIQGGPVAIAHAVTLVEPHHFWGKVHQDIFKNLCLLWDEGREINWRSVSDGLDATPYREVFNDDTTGPKRYVADLSTAYPYDATAMPVYAAKIRDGAERRAMISVANRLILDAQDETKETGDIKGAAVESLLMNRSGAHQLSAMAGDVLNDGLEAEIMAYLDDPSFIAGARTGVPIFDRVLGGLEKGRVYTVLADTSIGKSFFTHWMARQVSLHGHSPLIFSTEMPKREVVQRLAFMEGQLDRLQVRFNGAATPEERWRMQDGMVTIKEKRKIAVSYAANMDISTMASEIRRRQMTSGVDVVMADHIQGLRAEGISMAKEREMLNSVTAGIKQIAGDLDVPILQISHIHRPGDDTSMIRPTLRQAHGSGSIERDSDAVLSIYPVAITTRADGSWLPSDFADRAGFLRQQRTGRVAMEIMVQKSRAGGSARAIYWLDYSKGGLWIPQDERNLG